MRDASLGVVCVCVFFSFLLHICVMITMNRTIDGFAHFAMMNNVLEIGISQ